MGSVDGRRLGKAARLARLQSKYSDVSAVAQNSRSSSSLLNFGITLSFFIVDLSYILEWNN